MGLNIGSIAASFLPKIGQLLSSPEVKQLLTDLAGQAGKSLFDKTGKAVFSDTITVAGLRLPNPLKALENKLLGSIPASLRGLVGKLAGGLIEKLTGSRTLENGKTVNVPAASQRPSAAAPFAEFSKDNGSIWGAAAKAATDHGLSDDQSLALKGLKSPELERQTAMFRLQNYQQMVEFISNSMKMRSDTQKAIISNLR